MFVPSPFVNFWNFLLLFKKSSSDLFYAQQFVQMYSFLFKGSFKQFTVDIPKSRSIIIIIIQLY